MTVLFVSIALNYWGLDGVGVGEGGVGYMHLRWKSSGGQLSDSFYTSTASPPSTPCQCMISCHIFTWFFEATFSGSCKCECVCVCLRLCPEVAISGLDGGAWWRQETQATTGRWLACHATTARSGPA